MTRCFLLLAPLVWMFSCAVGASAQEGKSAPHAAAPPEAAAAAADHAHQAETPQADAHGESAHGGAGHAGHDPADLGHGNHTPALGSPTDFRFDMAIYSFVVFLILLGVLFKFAWNPIAYALQEREETIARQIEDARLASETASKQLREYEAKLAAATEEARHIVSAARKDAEVAKDRIVAEARDAAQKERERAVADITAAKNLALDQIAQKSVQTAVSLASQIIRREVQPQEHEALIGEAIGEFSKMN